MSTRPSSLGRCPHCGADIDSADALISYERDGDTTHYAECPSCLTVVRPE
jgi:uncharacterized C2H2 Zn-finger protein